MAAAHVQSTSAQATGTAPVPVSVTLNGVTTGNLLVLAVSGFAGGGGGPWSGTPTISVSGGQAVTWVRVVHAGFGSNFGIVLYYAQNAIAGSYALTVTPPTGSTDAAVAFAEYSGMLTASVLDKSATGNNTGSSLTTAATAATAQADELIIGAFSHDNNTPTITAGSGFTLRQSVANSSTSIGIALEEKIVSATGTQTAAITYTTSQNNAGIVATFKASAVATEPTLSSSVTTDDITWSWTAITGAVRYELQVDDSNTFPSPDTFIIDAPTLSYVDNNRATGTWYGRVAAWIEV